MPWSRAAITLLLGRMGIGASLELGGSDNRIHPEGNLGMDLEHKLTERQKVTASADYYQDLLDIREYRATAKLAWEVLLDPASKLSLKAGVEDRYDSSPGAGKRNDIDYSLLLSLAF